METKKNIIPENKNGKSNDLTATMALHTHAIAVERYNQAKTRMLNPSTWHAISGALSATFELVDSTGKTLNRSAETGDYIKVDLPGPGPAAGSGYDWVVVELVEETHRNTQQECSLRVRPATPPFAKDGPTAHFFTEAATSTFIVERMNNLVMASYHGRNEQLNTDTGNVADNVRNAAVGVGAMAGFSEAQWYSLIRGFLAET